MASVLRVLLPLRLVTTVHNRFPNQARYPACGVTVPITVSGDIADWFAQRCGTPRAADQVVHNGIEEPAQYSLEEVQGSARATGVSDQSLVLCGGSPVRAEELRSSWTHWPGSGSRRWTLLLVGGEATG